MQEQIEFPLNVTFYPKMLEAFTTSLLTVETKYE